MEAFSSLDVYKNLLDLDGLKCELKSVYAADFAKQASSIQEVADIIRELELNQALAEVTNLLRLILTLPATSASCEESFSSLKRVNNYMRCSQSEEGLSNLVFISMNKDLLKMEVERGAVTFYSKVIDEFAKKKRRIELIYKYILNISLFKSPTLKSENSKLEEYSKNHGQLEKPQNLTLQQLEWSKQMMRWVTVGFFAVHTGFQDIICEMEKENDHCSKFDPRKPYYWKLTTVMARCVMDWLSKNDFLDIMMQIFNTYLQRGNTSNVSGSQPGDLSFSTLTMKAITPTVAWTSGKVDTGDEEKQKERTSLTGDLLRNYILLGRRMVLCCLMKLENENPIPQEQKESKQKEL